jgi:N-terminal half of MaoC dehydratase
MANMTVEEVKKKWAGVEFDRTEIVIDERKMLGWARSCGETDPRFVDPSHPEFQAHPGFATQFGGPRHLPEGFPPLGNGRGIDGGKAIELYKPIHAGDVLTGTSMIADVYAKTGRSGTMIFIVHRMTLTNQDGEKVAAVDWRMIRNTD